MWRRTAALITAIIKIAGRGDDLQGLIDEIKNVLSRTWDKAKREAIIEAIRNLERFSGPVTLEELQHQEEIISRRLGADLAVLVRQPVIDVTETVYGLGLRQAAADAGIAGTPGVGIRWNLPDLKSLDILNRNTLFWVGDYYNSQVQGGFKEVLQEFFRGGYNRDQIAEMLEDTFADLGPRSKAYWDLLADHTCTKVREVGRLSGYEQAGIEYLEIRAWLDERTTAICRSMHGRIISVREVRRFVDNYLAACESGDPEAVKQAWPMWSDKNFRAAGIAGTPSGDLTDSGVGLPPYHFRCRTITVSHFQVLDDQGHNVVNRGQEVAFWDGEKQNKQTIAWEMRDRLGRKITVTEEGISHIALHGVSPEKIKAGLNSIRATGENNWPEAKGEAIYRTQNGLVMFFRGNVLMSAFEPGRNIDRYFRDRIIPGTRQVVKRWRFLGLLSG
jgi:SPP1 gp7 family putative phage head morphogenesis protein